MNLKEFLEIPTFSTNQVPSALAPSVNPTGFLRPLAPTSLSIVSAIGLMLSCMTGINSSLTVAEERSQMTSAFFGEVPTLACPFTLTPAFRKAALKTPPAKVAGFGTRFKTAKEPFPGDLPDTVTSKNPSSASSTLIVGCGRLPTGAVTAVLTIRKLSDSGVTLTLDGFPAPPGATETTIAFRFT
ncbi:MAG: hypothetical protein BWX66_00797 [Deltaproteobacteria bacterium ADurb.Bin058]|nr:MAG: hypothetical protein BWX66_00797 [Deltaproteobacteria bacterium ADurb.Bin058]